MVQKSNTKVHNFSTHPVKGCNPYDSQWPTHSISQNWQQVRSLWFRTVIFFNFKLLFSLGKCSFWLISQQFFPSNLKTTNSQAFTHPNQFSQTFKALKRSSHYPHTFIVQELCESWGGCPGLSVLTSLMASVDVKLYWTVLWHWSQLVPNMSTDIWGH